MKYYTFPVSPNCRKVAAVLNHLNIAHDVQVIDLTKDDAEAPAFIAVNPHGRVPALEDGDLKLWESNTLMRYLAERGGSGSDLYPADAKARAEISKWMDWQLAHLGSACGGMAYENFVKGLFGGGGPDAAAVAEAESDFHDLMPALESHLATRKWLVGEKPTLADFSIGSLFQFAVPGKYPMAKYGNVKAWLGRLEGLAAWKATAPQMMG